MKFILERDQFLKALSQAIKALPTRSTLPILQNLLLEVKGGKLNLSATNLDFSTKETLVAEDPEDGICTVPGKPLYGIVSSLPSISLSFSSGDRITKITTEKGTYTLVGSSPEDFPRFKDLESEKKLSLTKEAFLTGSGYVGFCAAKEDPRAFLTGVLLELKDNKLRLVASDSHKLGVWTKQGVPGEEFSAILPRGIFDFLRSREEPEIEIRYTQNMIGFYFKNAFLLSRLIEGPYAPYEGVLPKEKGNVLIIGWDEFTNALRRITQFTQSPTYLIKWHLSPRELILSASSPDIGEAEEHLTGSYKGESIVIGFNSQYLFDIARHIEDAELEFHFYSPLQAAIIKPAKLPEDEELVYLLMPVKLE